MSLFLSAASTAFTCSLIQAATTKFAEGGGLGGANLTFEKSSLSTYMSCNPKVHMFQESQIVSTKINQNVMTQKAHKKNNKQRVNLPSGKDDILSGTSSWQKHRE